MPQKTRLSLFAEEEFQTLIEKVAVKGETICVPHESLAKAQVLRNDFYQYRKLLRLAGKTEQADLADFIVARLALATEEPSVTFLPRSGLKQTAGLRKALGME